MNFNKSLGSKFKKLRNAIGLDQDSISKVLSIPRTAVSLMENGTREISARELDLLCRVYRTSPNEILGWKRTKPDTDDL